MSFKYTDSIQRPGAGAQGLGKMVTNTEVSAQDKAADGKDLDTRVPWDGGLYVSVCLSLFCLSVCLSVLYRITDDDEAMG